MEGITSRLALQKCLRHKEFGKNINKHHWYLTIPRR